PFEATAARPGAQWDEVIEQIDIGGPSLVRAAAKNHAFVAVATSPLQYSQIAEQLVEQGGTTLELRRQLAAAAFAHTAGYGGASAGYVSRRVVQERCPPVITLSLRRQCDVRYGENPQQHAALYRLDIGAIAPNLVASRQLQGKELSYNNL